MYAICHNDSVLFTYLCRKYSFLHYVQFYYIFLYVSFSFEKYIFFLQFYKIQASIRSFIDVVVIQIVLPQSTYSKEKE